MSTVDDRIMVRRIVEKFADDALFQADVERWLSEKLREADDKESLHQVIQDAVDDAVAQLPYEIAADVARAIEKKNKEQVAQQGSLGTAK